MMMTYTKPNQPYPKVLQKQVRKDQTMTFQKAWYEKYPWLHVSMGSDGVLCFHCPNTLRQGNQHKPRAQTQSK